MDKFSIRQIAQPIPILMDEDSVDVLTNIETSKQMHHMASPMSSIKVDNSSKLVNKQSTQILKNVKKDI
jgi:hypothetical protein